MSFENDIRRFEQMVSGASGQTIRAAALEVFTLIIERTPVDTGRARGNWQTSTNARPSGTLPIRNANRAVAEANLSALTYTLADTIYFANNLPYIQRLENGGAQGSQQAPAGMVQVSLDGFTQAVERNARNNRT